MGLKSGNSQSHVIFSRLSFLPSFFTHKVKYMLFEMHQGKFCKLLPCQHWILQYLCQLKWFYFLQCCKVTDSSKLLLNFFVNCVCFFEIYKKHRFLSAVQYCQAVMLVVGAIRIDKGFCRVRLIAVNTLRDNVTSCSTEALG